MRILRCVVYNCFEQYITIRERRRANPREAAARSVRDKVQVHESWKAARDAAKKHAAQLRTEISQRFSSRQGSVDIDNVMTLNIVALGVDKEL